MRDNSWAIYTILKPGHVPSYRILSPVNPPFVQDSRRVDTRFAVQKDVWFLPLERQAFYTNGREREMYVTPGVVWRLPLNCEIGVGAPVGLTDQSDKYGVVVKVIYEFNLLHRGGGQ